MISKPYQNDGIFFFFLFDHLDPAQRFAGELGCSLYCNVRVLGDDHKAPSKLSDRCTASKCLEGLFLGRRDNTLEGGVTGAGVGMVCFVPVRTVTWSERGAEGKEADGRERDREFLRFGFGEGVGLATVPRTIIAQQMNATSTPNREEHRHSSKPVTTPMTEEMRRLWPLIRNIIVGNGNLHQRQAIMMTHGVSGFACTGIPGEFNDQRRGMPHFGFPDPMSSQFGGQSHIGIPLNTFNESWSSGELRDGNFDNAVYRQPLIGEPLIGPPAPRMADINVAPVVYPDFVGEPYPQQFPLGRIHDAASITPIHSQNLTFEVASLNGDNKVFMPQTPVPVTPNTVNFQGSTTATNVHPNNDKAGQQTTANTSKPQFTEGQAPTQKLPSGTAVGSILTGDTPVLWNMAPPPVPQVLPQEGTAPLQPTVPKYW